MDPLSLITLVVIVAVLGFIVWILITYVPMPEPFKRVLIVVVVVALLLWILRAFVTGVPLLR